MLVSVTLNPSVDHTLFVDRIVLGDTNRVSRVERDAGGKGINVARVFAELGGSAIATGFLGGGPGSYVTTVLSKQGVDHRFISVQEDTRINFSVECADGSTPTTFNERGPQIQDSDWNLLLAQVKELASRAKWIAMGGSVPPGLPKDAFSTLIKLGRDCGCRVVLDADGEAFAAGLRAGPHFVKPNDREASRLLGRPVETREQAIQAAKSILTTINEADDAPSDPLVVLSRGSKGAIAATKNLCIEALAPEVKSVSTVGSGDSLVAGVIWALEQSMPLEEALAWGVGAGAATAMTDGSEIARLPVIQELLPRVRVSPA